MNFKNYMLFYEHLYDYPGSTNNLLETLGKQLNLIAPDLCLAKMDIEIQLPPIFCERFPYTFRDTIFDTGKETNFIPVSTDFTTTQDGLITITAYSEKNVKWSREQISEIIFLNEQIQVLINRSRLQSQIKKAEETDPVTTVLNLAGVIHVGELLNIKKIMSKFSVISLNINNFKEYNKKYGHLNGDIILKSFATSMSDFIEKDGIIGRTSADSFVIIVKTTRVMDIIKHLEKFSLRIELEDMSKVEISFSFRIGVCHGDAAGYFPQLVVNASAALKKTSKTEAFSVEYFKKA